MGNLTNSAFNYDDLNKLFSGLQVEGGGNGDYQNALVQMQSPQFGGVSAFGNAAVSNNPWTGFKAASPELGVAYDNPNFNVRGSYQNQVPIDKRVHGWGAPDTEKMYRMNLNIPFSS